MTKPAPESQETQRYWWFQGQSVQTLRAYLDAAGPDPRIEVRPHGHQVYLCVVATTSAAAKRPVFPEINESHACPPSCP